jgi:3'-phosphoadenosine 5'-phosphosulfate sulfotransferase
VRGWGLQVRVCGGGNGGSEVVADLRRERERERAVGVTGGG